MYNAVDQESVQAATLVDQASADISTACERLEVAAGHLRERLNKALGPEMDSPTVDRALTALRASSEFTCRLRGHSARINEVADRLHDVLNRLEL